LRTDGLGKPKRKPGTEPNTPRKWPPATNDIGKTTGRKLGRPRNDIGRNIVKNTMRKKENGTKPNNTGRRKVNIVRKKDKETKRNGELWKKSKP